MSRYIAFPSGDGPPVLVEVTDNELVSSSGVSKAGLRDRGASGAVATAQQAFDEAVGRAIRTNVDTVDKALAGVARPPDTVELQFALKATGELGNIALGKLGGEANVSVKLTWTGRPEG